MASEKTNKIGEKIASERKKKKLSQTELSQKTGRSLSSIQKYELGSVIPNLKILRKIADALEISVYDLLDIPEIAREDAYLPQYYSYAVLGEHSDQKRIISEEYLSNAPLLPIRLQPIIERFQGCGPDLALQYAAVISRCIQDREYLDFLMLYDSLDPETKDALSRILHLIKIDAADKGLDLPLEFLLNERAKQNGMYVLYNESENCYDIYTSLRSEGGRGIVNSVPDLHAVEVWLDTWEKQKNPPKDQEDPEAE